MCILFTRAYWLELWRTISTGFIYGLVFVSLIMVISILLEPYFSRPPIEVVGLDGPYLGVLCPGDHHAIHNLVTIERPVIASYRVTVMDEAAVFNFVGLQHVYEGYQHPFPVTFEQFLPWRVPDLPPGPYARSFSARGTDSAESSVFVVSTFTIGDDCNAEH